MKINLVFGILVSVLAAGCATTSKFPPPKAMETSNEFFNASASTNCDSDGCKSFDFVVTNKTAKDIKLDWNKTLFVSNGQSSGGLYFDGIVIRDRNMPRPPQVIFANGSHKVKVVPNMSMELNLFPLAHWSVKPMPTGEAGIYVVADVDGKEVTSKMTTQVR